MISTIFQKLIVDIYIFKSLYDYAMSAEFDSHIQKNVLKSFGLLARSEEAER